MTPMEDLGNQIRKWILKKSLETSNNLTTTPTKVPVEQENQQHGKKTKSPQQTSNNDDLYDF
jgi:hypothetical protein